jgi:2-C-methyl-D-erythritol 2,4-cyclodiphosphate synthase
MRVGVGYDSHRFAAGRKLMLGGIEIPHDRGLDGWSDADAVAHALTDAILGAAGLGDIGRLFPPNDPKWRNADSITLLANAHERARASGVQFAQGDITVVAEQPRLAPFVDRMQQRLAGALGVPPGRVSVKAKSNEGMGWIGRGEGIAVIAVALLEPADTRA